MKELDKSRLRFYCIVMTAAKNTWVNSAPWEIAVLKHVGS
jgi:hypothetical protein